MPARRATGQSLRGYSTPMKSTEQVLDAHRALPWCFTTSPRSGATSPGTGPGYNRTQAVKRLHLDHTLTGGPEQRRGLRCSPPRRGPGIILGATRAVRRKKRTACYRHGRIDPHQIRKFANEGNPGKCSNVEILLRTDQKSQSLAMGRPDGYGWIARDGGLPHQLDPFEDRGDALAAADAHRDQRVPAAGPAQLVEGLDDQDGAGGAERVTQGDAAAVRVGPFRRKAELGGDGEGLRGERLVHLEHVDVIHLQVGALKNLAHRGYRSDAHHARLDASVAVGDEPADWVVPVPFGIILTCQDHGRCGVVDARSVTRGDRAFLGEGRLQPGQVS